MIKKKPIVFARLDKRERRKLLHSKNVTLTYEHEGIPFEKHGIQTVRRVSGTHGKSKWEIIKNIQDAGSNFIIIDEYVFFRDTDALEKAVIKAKEMNPDLYIIMWNSAVLTKKAAKFFKKHVDMVFLETYWPWKMNWLMWVFFDFLNYKKLKKYNLERRAIFVLGINDSKEKRKEDFPEDLWGSFSWANDEKTLKKQMKYIKKHCKRTPGIGFFVKGGTSDKMLRTADRLAGQIW